MDKHDDISILIGVYLHHFSNKNDFLVSCAKQGINIFATIQFIKKWRTK